MDLSRLSNQEIQTAIQKMQKGIEIKPNSQEAIELQTSIDRALEELQCRAQKKSVAQPIEKLEQLEETEKIKRAVLNPSLDIPTLYPSPEKLAAEKLEQLAEKARQEFEISVSKLIGSDKPSELFKESLERHESRVIGTVTAAPVISVPVVEIALSSGTKRMTRTEIMTMLKTWFKRVATSKAMEAGRYSDAYGSSMGQDTYKLFQGWNVIYNETKEGAAWPPLVDVFPGLARASQAQKVCAELLWRWATNDK